MPLRLVYLVQLGLVSGGFHTFLKRQNAVVTGHDSGCLKFQSFCQMHCADENASVSVLV